MITFEAHCQLIRRFLNYDMMYIKSFSYRQVLHILHQILPLGATLKVITRNVCGD
jgi:hypothetical protein